MSDLPTFPMIINGAKEEGINKTPVKNPANHSIVGYVTTCTPTQLDCAVAAASAAQKDWAKSSNDERRTACQKIAEVITENADELTQLLTLEQGKPLKGLGSEFEVGGAAAWAGYTASLDLPVKVLEENEQKRVEQHRVPVGVVGSITPWNWPLMIAIWHVVPAIRAGNAVIIKPSPFTPLSTLRMVELINDVLPKGVLNCVSGDGDVGAMMSAHEGINKMVFTGSTPTGKAIMRSAASSLKRLTLELGGNDAGIVLDDADPDSIAEELFWGAFINGGQTCAALKRLYVHNSIYDQVCEALSGLANQIPMGDGLDHNNMLGPMQNKMQFDKVSALVEDAVERGGCVLTGGKAYEGNGYFYPVTLVADVPAGSRLIDEEQFGCALPIIRYDNLDDAIAQANQLDVGLAASVWSSNSDRAYEVAQSLEAGTVYINKHGEIAPNIPFGGIKGSGIGVEFGQEGLEANTDIKIFNIAK
jgi:acyl-CoA reductase-like NAD-dependent aldehyde dehydrogenase